MRRKIYCFNARLDVVVDGAEEEDEDGPGRGLPELDKFCCLFYPNNIGIE